MDLNIPLVVSIGNSALMLGAIIFGAGRLKQSVVGFEEGLEKGLVGVQKQQDATNEKLAEIGEKVGKVQTAVAKLQGFNEGVQDERNRQGA